MIFFHFLWASNSNHQQPHVPSLLLWKRACARRAILIEPVKSVSSSCRKKQKEKKSFSAKPVFSVPSPRHHSNTSLISLSAGSLQSPPHSLLFVVATSHTHTHPLPPFIQQQLNHPHNEWPNSINGASSVRILLLHFLAVANKFSCHL